MHGLEIILEDARWADAGLATTAQKAVPAVLETLDVVQDAAEVVVLGCNDKRIAELNGDFRNKDRATNILSWPDEELAPDTVGAVPKLPSSGPDGVISLGNLAIAYETCAREAEAQAKPFAAHVTHLLVHGTLHLLGYDHIEDADAARMEALEIKILGTLGLPDPY